MRYPQIVRAVTETPWAILPSKLLAICEMVELRASGVELTEQEIEAKVGPGPARKDTYQAGSVAVLPLYGVITPKADVMTEMSGGTSVQRFRAALQQAAADPAISSILMDIDSPGGMTAGIQELAADIRAAKAQKPVVAVANTKADSAAYWLGTQASQFYVTPSGEVGSVGVIAAHQDLSAMAERDGVKMTFISAGKHKAEINQFTPLSDEAKAAIQDRVDEEYGAFTRDVAKGRGVTVDVVRSGFGEGRVLSANRAVKEGMVDGVATYEQVLDRLVNAPQGDGTSQAALSGLSFADEATALRDKADALVVRAASLAEVERGHLTVAKRERLTACTEALRGSATAIDALLAETDPNKHNAEAARIFDEWFFASVQ